MSACHRFTWRGLKPRLRGLPRFAHAEFHSSASVSRFRLRHGLRRHGGRTPASRVARRAVPRRQLVEGAQPRARAAPSRNGYSPSDSACRRPRRARTAVGGGDGVRRRHAGIARPAASWSDLSASSAPGPAGPERPDERQPGHRRPLLAQIDLLGAGALDGRRTARRRQSPAPRRSGAASRPGRGAIGDELRGDPEASRSRARAAARSTSASWCRRRSCECPRSACVVNSATDADRPFRHDRHVRAPRDTPDAAQVLDGRDHADVDRALVQQRRALRRRVELQREAVAQLEAVDQRPRVQVVDRAEPDRSHRALRHRRGARSGRCARPGASRPRGCCRGFPRAGCAAVPERPRIGRGDAVDVVGADDQRRPARASARRAASRPGSTACPQQQPRQRHRLHVVVAGRRRRDGRAAAAAARTRESRRPRAGCRAPR